MSWLTPVTGAILAAAVIPPLVLLYFLKLRRRPAAIASTLLWQRAVEDLRANAPFQRLRRSLLLLLQLIALLLLVVSVMQPQIRAGRQKGGRTVLLVDNSASMTARDVEGGGTRLDEAKRRARQRIEAMYAGGILAASPGETMVIAFSDRVEIASRFSRSKRDLLAAVDQIRPTHGRTMIGEALKLARAYTTNVDPDSDRPVGAPAALEVFTDGRIADLDEQVLRGERMTYHRVGSPEPDNVGIATVSVERPYDRPTSVVVFAAVANYDREPVVCGVQLSVDGTALAIEDITIPAAEMDAGSGVLTPGRKSAVFTPFEQPRGAVIEVANLRPDDLAADDAAQVVVPPPKRLRVALVPDTSFFVRQVLEGMPLERLDLLPPEQYEAYAGEGGLGGYDVIVFDGYAPPEGLMPPGRYLCFGPTPPLPGLNDFGEHDGQLVLNVRSEHPVLRFVNLDKLRIASGRLLQPAEDVAVLVEGSDGPLVVSVARGPMQVLLVTFEPGQSTWPLLRSWVTFVFNAVDHLGHIGEGLTSQDVPVGEALTARLPADARDVTLRLPDGTVEEIEPADPRMFSWGPVRLVGPYLLSWKVAGADEPETRAFAVNMSSEDEGRLDAAASLSIGQEEVSGTAAAASAYTPLWPWAIGACLAVLMLEWWVYHRKTWV